MYVSELPAASTACIQKETKELQVNAEASKQDHPSPCLSRNAAASTACIQEEPKELPVDAEASEQEYSSPCLSSRFSGQMLHVPLKVLRHKGCHKRKVVAVALLHACIPSFKLCEPPSLTISWPNYRPSARCHELCHNDCAVCNCKGCPTAVSSAKPTSYNPRSGLLHCH